MAALNDSFSQKLLKPGYAGDLSLEELQLVKPILLKNRRLRALWGMGRGTGRLSEEKIRLVAENGVEALQNPPQETSTPSVQLRVKNEIPPPSTNHQLRFL